MNEATKNGKKENINYHEKMTYKRLKNLASLHCRNHCRTTSEVTLIPTIGDCSHKPVAVVAARAVMRPQGRVSSPVCKQ